MGNKIDTINGSTSTSKNGTAAAADSLLDTMKHGIEDLDVKRTAGKVVEAADLRLEKSKESLRNFSRDVVTYIEDRPVQSMGIAFAVGAVLTAGLSFWMRPRK